MLKNIQFKLLSLLLCFVAISFYGGITLFQFGVKNHSRELLNLSSLLAIFDGKSQQKIGRYYLQNGNEDLAIDYYNRARRLEPKEYTNYILIADILLKNGNIKGAAENYLTAVSLDPLDLTDYQKKVDKLFMSKPNNY